MVFDIVSILEAQYSIQLPSYQAWFLQRIDIAICYDLANQENLKNYINSLSKCSYPRRKLRFFANQSIYLDGTTTTLKVYNKLLEFRKHDLARLKKTDFDLENYQKEIQGFLRFECEIKKKKLEKLYNNKNISVMDVKYEDLREVWSEEFMKLLKFVESDLEVVRTREEVFKRLHDKYDNNLANSLYGFYSLILLDGISNIKSSYNRSTYYKYLKCLKEARVDFSQSYDLKEIEVFTFNPFTATEVA